MSNRSLIRNVGLGDVVRQINRRMCKHYQDEFKPHNVRLQAMPLNHYELVRQGLVFIVAKTVDAYMYSGAIIRFNYCDFDVLRVSKYDMHPETHPVICPEITVHYSQLVPRRLRC